MIYAAKAVERILRRLGGPVELEKEGLHRFYAVLQPVRDRNKQYLEQDADLYGRVERGEYLCFCPWGAGSRLLEGGDRVRCREEVYQVRRCETFFFEGAPLYRWAVLRRAVKEE